MVRLRGLTAAVLAAVLAALAALPATGQEAASRAAPRRVLLLFDTAPGAEFEATERLLLYESLLIRLGRATVRIAVIEYGEDALPASEEMRTRAATSLRADAWVQVTVGGRWPELTVSTRCFDLLSDSMAFERSFRATLRRGAVELERRFWDPVTDAVLEALPGSGRETARAVSREQLTLSGVPGTRIRGLGEETLRLAEDGTVSLEALLPATVSFRATRLGYEPVIRDLYLEPGLDTLELAQKPGARWGLGGYLQMMSYPGFEASFYPVRDFHWIRAGFTTYLVGLALAERSESSMLVSHSLSHLNLSTGIYLNASDRLLRYYLGAGVFARLITAREWVIALEPIAPWGFEPILGVEISRHPRRRFYLEHAPRFYPTRYPGLFWLSLPPEGNRPVVPIPWEEGMTPVLFWEFSVLRFGLRWRL